VVTFAFGGLSKLLCAPQLKLSWIRLSGPASQLRPVRDALDQIADTFLSVNSAVAQALPELLDLAVPTVAATCSRLAQNLATARRVLSPVGIRVRRCEGGWTALIDLPKGFDGASGTGAGRPSDDPVPECPANASPGGIDPAIWLMRQAHLAAHPGWFYDLVEPRSLALSLLPEPDRFENYCARLRAALKPPTP
jgi:hypothetical protein